MYVPICIHMYAYGSYTHTGTYIYISIHKVPHNDMRTHTDAFTHGLTYVCTYLRIYVVCTDSQIHIHTLYICTYLHSQSKHSHVILDRW